MVCRSVWFLLHSFLTVILLRDGPLLTVPAMLLAVALLFYHENSSLRPSTTFTQMAVE
jgi:hypothetical protein